MRYFVEVFHKNDYGHHKEKGIKNRLAAAGLDGVSAVKAYTIYQIDGPYTAAQAEKIAKDLLCDPVLETYKTAQSKPAGGEYKVEVWIRDSSTDVVGESVKDAIFAMGFAKPESVRIARAFNVKGTFKEAALEKAVKKTFVNEMLNKFSIIRGA